MPNFASGYSLWDRLGYTWRRYLGHAAVRRRSRLPPSTASPWPATVGKVLELLPVRALTHEESSATVSQTWCPCLPSLSTLISLTTAPNYVYTGSPRKIRILTDVADRICRRRSPRLGFRPGRTRRAPGLVEVGGSGLRVGDTGFNSDALLGRSRAVDQRKCILNCSLLNPLIASSALGVL